MCRPCRKLRPNYLFNFSQIEVLKPLVSRVDAQIYLFHIRLFTALIMNLMIMMVQKIGNMSLPYVRITAPLASTISGMKCHVLIAASHPHIQLTQLFVGQEIKDI
ncbi:hypothetical protein D9D84_04735 [Escherichia coli]|nr:hypothetical protein [Escherichia coli]OKW04745.1 hypothetical protein AWP69_07180 [Escherichia coli]OKW08235.1 hypothetical protein AWP69_00480 [Escherichia coli]